LALVWIVALRMARPIRELTGMADQVASGRLDIRPRRSSVFELDRLGISIGRVASQLGRRITETEEERRTMALVLGALTQGVILVGDGEEVLYANAAAGQVLGPIPAKATALVPRGIIHCVRRARLEGHVVEEELEHGSPPRRIIAIATPFEDDARVMVMVVDVTDRRRLEAMRRDFVADASHELKTPVSAILAAGEALEMAVDRDAAKAREFAGRIEASARQLSRIVADLLDLSRLEASEPSPDIVALDEVVRGEVAAIQRRATEASISLASEIADADVIGDSGDLALAVRNLLDNAIRYTDVGGSVRVVLHNGGDRAVLSVSDTGTGIPTRALGRVFERFYRVDEARSRATGGTGLGLAIVKHVVERHGGTVAVESQLGAGSTFRIELPVAKDGPRAEVPDPTAASTD
jgi:signal transduction histidine kinase/HAMP domain-containing protein